MSASCEVLGQRLVPRADRTLLWTEDRTLIVADPHFGKADAFRAFGVPVPGDAGEPLTRLAMALDDTRAERLVVLGDFWHARPGRTDAVCDRLAAWRAERPSLTVELVRGNHDRAGPPPPGWGRWHTEIVDPPFVFAHFPDTSPAGYTLAGHLHPGVLLFGRGKQRLNLPCFRFAERVGILPAFGGFTGLAVDVPRPGMRVFAVAEDSVIEVSVG